MSPKLNTDEFVFESTDRIGLADGENDDFLLDCFVDTGHLRLLADCSKPERIIVGRTGAGKTALLKKLLSSTSKAKVIKPESLALQYLSDSSIIRRLTDLGVHLELFYKLLWRHILAVELVRLKYDAHTQAGWSTDLPVNSVPRVMKVRVG